MAGSTNEMTIGELAERSGVATSALRFYESKGLIASERTPGNQRRFKRAMLRRVALIRVAQAVGITLDDVGRALAELPGRRNPDRRDWGALSASWRADLDRRIESLQQLRDDLDGCIGCGCLSLDTCALLNPEDRASAGGSGPRYLLGDEPG